MASTATPSSAQRADITSLPVDSISYKDLYARWERGNWSAMELDFTEDARQWREQFSEFQRHAAVWNYSLFFWGEDAVADNLSPFIDAAPLEEQKYFLATQQADEARHAVFFKRFMHEVVGLGDGSMSSSLTAIKPQLTSGFRKIFDRLDTMADELRADRSKPKLAEAVTLYHLVIEASLAQAGQHMIQTYLQELDLLPAFREGIEKISADEQRHIGFGVKLLSDLKREDRRVPQAVAKVLREVLPYSGQVLMPPDWDESYLTCFGFTFDRVGIEGVTSLQNKLRSAGMPMEELPGPPLVPVGLTPLEISQRGRALAQAGITGVREGPSKKDPETLELLFDTMRRQVNPNHGLRGSTTFQYEFNDPDVSTWHLVVNNGSSEVRQGAAPSPDLSMRASYQDFVDIVGNRLNPLRALASGRLRLKGNPLMLTRLTKVFPRD